MDTDKKEKEFLDAVIEQEEDLVADPGWRLGKKIVFTSGCFDILHAGHVLFLEEAHALGDLLVVALNDDRSVRKIKGTDRPTYPVHERAEVLAALKWVDRIVLFSNDRPIRAIQLLKPEIYVKDESYREQVDSLPEARLIETQGGQVVLLDRLPGFSTTEVRDIIREKTGPIRLPSC
ncbi:MAG: adenylyltransferase/cytidyltransferase family protein [bacterium]|jgi:rfaE bifunctional protein nucleotidyltransferase chain/domain|nr:adenylyltransferase/cytidyltransferase family protein [bacterium]